MMSFCNDEYMNVLFHHCTGKILDAVFLHTLLKNVPQLNRFWLSLISNEFKCYWNMLNPIVLIFV